MCVVSNVTDYYQSGWGKTPVEWDRHVITAKEYEEYQRLKRNAAEIDKLTKQPDCIKPDLAEWEKRLDDYLVKRGLIRRNG